PIDWSGGLGIPPGGVILEGDQCLVFFLGGIPTANPNACLGFSTNPKNPTRLGGDRIGPFFEGFTANPRRPAQIHNTPTPPNPFYSYIDGYGLKPYAYFSSYRRANGYMQYPFNATATPPDLGDCNFTPTSLKVSPYAQTWPTAAAPNTPIRYLNPNTFQIISAGRDRVFGPGTIDATTTWTSATANLIALPGQDDLSNFYDARLGVSQ